MIVCSSIPAPNPKTTPSSASVDLVDMVDFRRRSKVVDYRPREDYRCGELPVIFSVDRKADLLPHFVRHYRNQGVTDFVCVAWEGSDLSFIREHLPERSLIVDPAVPFFLGYQDSHLQLQVRHHHAPSSWCVVADLDEMHEVPGFTLREAVDAASAAGADAIVGEFVDRVTMDGSIPEHLEDDLWQQFPLQTRMTLRIKTWAIHKVLAVAPGVDWSSGHHCYERGKEWAHYGRCHHFTWWGDVVDRMRERLGKCQEVGAQWGTECTRMVEAVERNHGRLPVLHPPASETPRHWRIKN